MNKKIIIISVFLSYFLFTINVFSNFDNTKPNYSYKIENLSTYKTDINKIKILNNGEYVLHLLNDKNQNILLINDKMYGPYNYLRKLNSGNNDYVIKNNKDYKLLINGNEKNIKFNISKSDYEIIDYISDENNEAYTISSKTDIPFINFAGKEFYTVLNIVHNGKISSDFLTISKININRGYFYSIGMKNIGNEIFNYLIIDGKEIKLDNSNLSPKNSSDEKYFSFPGAFKKCDDLSSLFGNNGKECIIENKYYYYDGEKLKYEINLNIDNNNENDYISNTLNKYKINSHFNPKFIFYIDEKGKSTYNNERIKYKFYSLNDICIKDEINHVLIDEKMNVVKEIKDCMGLIKTENNTVNTLHVNTFKVSEDLKDYGYILMAGGNIFGQQANFLGLYFNGEKKEIINVAKNSSYSVNFSIIGNKLIYYYKDIKGLYHIVYDNKEYEINNIEELLLIFADGRIIKLIGKKGENINIINYGSDLLGNTNTNTNTNTNIKESDSEIKKAYILSRHELIKKYNRDILDNINNQLSVIKNKINKLSNKQQKDVLNKFYNNLEILEKNQKINVIIKYIKYYFKYNFIDL